MTELSSLDELLDYIADKKISAHKIAKASGYCRTHIRNIIEGLINPTSVCLETVIEATLDIGEQVTFTRMEMELVKSRYTNSCGDVKFMLKPESMTEREWQTFLGKIS